MLRPDAPPTTHKAPAAAAAQESLPENDAQDGSTVEAAEQRRPSDKADAAVAAEQMQELSVHPGDTCELFVKWQDRC